MNISDETLARLQRAKVTLHRYLDTGKLLDCEKERASFLLHPDPSREVLSDHSLTEQLIADFETHGARAIFEANAALTCTLVPHA